MLHGIIFLRIRLTIHADSSHYPHEHTYLGYSQDAGDLESDVARVIDKLPTQTGRTLREAVEFFVESVSRCDNDETTDGNDSGEDEVDFMMFDEDFEESGILDPNTQTTKLSLGHLKKYALLMSPNLLLMMVYRDFVEVKAAGYNPGILWTGSDKFILSVSLPVPDLFQNILPHALLAWDRHFLRPGLHLTLLISGFRDVYPVLRQDGTLVPNLLRTGSALKFKVGFTSQYKPSKINATAAFKQFLVQNTATDGKEDAGDATPPDLPVDMTNLENDSDPGGWKSDAFYRTEHLYLCFALKAYFRG